jgi:sensor histidine kinase YesM
LSEGVGLSNTRARLKHLYGAEHNFVLQTRDGGGLRLDLQIPFRSNEEK